MNRRDIRHLAPEDGPAEPVQFRVAGAMEPDPVINGQALPGPAPMPDVRDGFEHGGHPQASCRRVSLRRTAFSASSRPARSSASSARRSACSAR